MLCLTAFPEIGASLGLRSRLPQSTNGWTEINGWTHTSLPDSGRFLFGGPLSSKASRFQIPKSGIYFVSFSVHLSHANIGLFEAAVVINGKIAERNKPLSSARQGYQGAEFSLVVSGFVNVGSSEEISVFVFSEKDRDWTIQDNSQFALRYTGPMGIFPAFSASKGTVMKLLPSPLPRAIRNWETSGIPGVFISLTGFSSSTGQFVCICDGVFFLAANIRVQANQGTHRLHTLINNEIRGPFVDVKTYGEHQSIFTMNLYESVYLKRGDTVFLGLNSTSSEGVAILSDSGFFVSYIDVFNQSSLQGVSTVTKTINEIPGIGWMELTTLPIPSVTHVQFVNPEVFRMGRFTCTQSGIYYIAVSIKPHIVNKALGITASQLNVIVQGSTACLKIINDIKEEGEGGADRSRLEYWDEFFNEPSLIATPSQLDLTSYGLSKVLFIVFHASCFFFFVFVFLLNISPSKINLDFLFSLP